MSLQKAKLPSNTMTKLINELDAPETLWYSFFKVLAQNFQELIDDSGALRLPIFNDSNRPSPGIAGRVIFNTTSATINYDNGTVWVSV